MAVLNAVSAGLATVAELDEAFANFLESPGWRELQTRTARRMCDGSYTFNGDPFAAPPAHLQFAQGLIQKLVGHLQSSNPTSQVLPLQAFLCLYEDGEDACPNHVHDCRQLTLSLGADREVTVEGQRVMMRHGDILVLDGERHGVPAQKTKSSQSRVSINIFFTTSSDQASRPVSVNHQTGKGYRNSTSEKGQGKGSWSRRWKQ